MIRLVVGVVLVASAGSVAVPVGAAAVGATSVTIAAGPTTEASWFPPCQDVGVVYEESTSFVVSRDQTVGPLTVAYTESGTVQSSVHYEPLPGEVSFADGASTATIEVEPRPNAEGGVVELTLSLEGSGSATVGEPGSAAIKFLTTATDPSPCRYDFRFTDAPHNTRQDILVGQALEPFELELDLGGGRFDSFGPNGDLRHAVLGGALPPGIALACRPVRPSGGAQPYCSGPVPQGAATTPGTYVSTLEVCGVDESFDCETVDLTVMVRASASGPGLALTGSGPPWGAASAAALLGVGLLRMLRHERRRVRTSGSVS